MSVDTTTGEEATDAERLSIIATEQAILQVMPPELPRGRYQHWTTVATPMALEIPGLQELWAETLGDPRICIAILDGPVDLSHRSLAAARLKRVETLVSGTADRGPALQHGTHIASVIFGQHDGPI